MPTERAVAPAPAPVKAKAKLGETRRLARHARTLKAQDLDHSRDQDWPPRRCYSIVDCYAMAVTVPFLVLKTLLAALPMLVLAVVPSLVAKLYGSCCVRTRQERISRRCAVFAAMFPAFFPFLLLAVVFLLVDYVFYFVFGLPVLVVRCLCCQARVWSSYTALAPYRGGPSILYYLNDIFVALIGQVVRHGACETALKLAMTVIYVPWLKYFLNANPLLYSLEERFVQQISTSTSDMPRTAVVDAAKRLVNRAKPARDLAARIDASRFVPHYPYPPPERDWALGLQAGGNAFYTSFLVVHATHALEAATLQKRDVDYLAVSNSAELPYLRVILWYNNPYHFFTGYVEASVSSGGRSQPQKEGGFEHPMWVVTAHAPLLSDRTSWVGVGFVDRFFDTWFPWFVSEVRRLVRGSKAAVELHQLVVSQDGVSPPAPRDPEAGRGGVVEGTVVRA